jgi:DNA-directed RNA polymerase sigma subunit (sigma70/sigma32)
MPSCGVVQKDGRRHPGRKNSEEAVRRLCELCEASPEELFPGFVRERLTGKTHTLRATVEVGAEQLTGEAQKQLAYEVPWDQVDARLDAAETLPELLKTVSKREREVIKFRYGLTDGRAHTLPETVAVFRVSVARIRQIERMAQQSLTSSAKRLWPGEFWNDD